MTCQDRRGFTLLEVMVALGILALSLMVMIDMQTTSVVMTGEAERITASTALADEKMREVMIVLERDGWSSQDVAEQGDFSGFGDEDFRGESVHLDLGETLSDYSWAYTVRTVELNLPEAGLTGMTNSMAETAAASSNQAEDDYGTMDLSDFGVDAQMIGEYIQDYVREVRVVVWWGDNEAKDQQVELVYHAISASGVVQNPTTSGDS